MCQMYKREEGVNHGVVGVWVQIYKILSFILFIFFCFCFVFIAEEHTRHVSMFHCCRGMCAAI